MKRALVLSGGGSRGSYQIGAWKALRELGQEFDAVYGTSIGSINACLVAQNDFNLADEMWDGITVDQVMTDGINLDFSWEAINEQKKEILPFLTRYAKHRGADIAPLIKSVNKAVSEARVRASGMRCGMVTVKFPALTALEMLVEDIPAGRLIDYMMASAACFPAFPMYKIDGESYIDGGYYDNMPVNMALEGGAEEIVAVDLWDHLSHPQLLGRPFLSYVRPSQPLGSILSFEKDLLARNRLLGYRDTLRAFGKVLGFRYSFDAEEAKSHEMQARAFSLYTARLDGRIGGRHAVTRAMAGPPLAEALGKTGRPGREISYLNDLLRGAEAAAEKLGIDPFRLLTLEQLNGEIAAAVPFQAGDEAVRMLGGGDFAGLAKLFSQADKRLGLAAICAVLKSGNLPDGALRLIALLPEDLLCAAYIVSCAL